MLTTEAAEQILETLSGDVVTSRALRAFTEWRLPAIKLIIAGIEDGKHVTLIQNHLINDFNLLENGDNITVKAMRDCMEVRLKSLSERYLDLTS